MNSLLDSDTEDDLDDRPVRARDREITLGTTMVLGIFFALAAYGAVLFGFGYSLGAKHTGGTPASPETASAASFSGFKPAPGSPLGSAAAPAKPLSGPTVTVPDSPPTQALALPKPAPPARVQPEPAATDDAPAPTHPAAATLPAARNPPPSAPALASTPVAQPTAAGSFLVQVAAVSHQEDADLLVVTLKRRGYQVAVHHEPQDSLLHVQIGNFVNKKDADAMRQRLLADGFNAIVK